MMAVASGDGVEKLEDMIVRSAEMTSTHIAAAKAAIGAVIFGQELVVERTLITVIRARGVGVARRLPPVAGGAPGLPGAPPALTNPSPAGAPAPVPAPAPRR